MSIESRRRALMGDRYVKSNGFVAGKYVNTDNSEYWTIASNNNHIEEHKAWHYGNIFVPLKKTISINPTDTYSIMFSNGEPLSNAGSPCYFGLSLNQTQAGTVQSNANNPQPVRDVLYSHAGPSSGRWDFNYFFIRNRTNYMVGEAQFDVSIYINGVQII